ncbi:receptor protein kinase TMK1-like [Triticum urartu]|uniref:receptor protein kinase TMK1-like n=1 Tax=Triticum urartu TaxID=4572 RepID=UPI00204426B6|nr:receptor protein kinase TMK1-like [Triticum urartu]XP_048556483.1 receptor protein kinase TMK1-like [Triticum urartu]
MSSPLSVVAGCFLLLAASAIPGCVCVNDDYSMQTIATSLGADRALGWGNDSSPCTHGWTGVVCNERGRVTAIRARNASLNGTLPGEIALPWLKELDLRDNAITGQLPSTVFLRLDNNNFTSVAVGFLAGARSLQVFTISNNSQLEGWDLPNNPHTIGNLQDYIANNASITGTLSRFLGSSTFAALGSLSLGNNRLTGEVPTTFSSRTLTHLDLSANFLSGPLNFIAKLPELEELRLDRNSFTGPLPDFSGLWSLQVVTLAHNNLTGVVPATLVRLEGLSSVTLRNNLFQGPLPVFAGSVQTDVAEASLDRSFCRPQPGPCDSQGCQNRDFESDRSSDDRIANRRIFTIRIIET